MRVRLEREGMDVLACKTNIGVPAGSSILGRNLEEEEARLVFELLHLYREGSNLTVIAARLHELRDIRAQLRKRGAAAAVHIPA